MRISNMDSTYGSAFVGLVCSAVMYGLTTLQTYVYYRRYSNDSWKLKYLVLILWFLDTTHLVLCTIAIYWYLVTNFNDPAILLKNHWSINLQTDCNGLIGLLVESFFALRVYKVSRNRFLVAFIMILAFLHFGLGVLFTVEAFMLKEYSMYSRLTWVTSLGLGSAAAADIVIASSLCYFLHRNRTGFPRTDNLISTLMLYAINTGLLTSICATAAVVTFAIMPTNFVWLSFFWVLGKFYVNSLLATLNSREGLREKTKPLNSFVQLSTYSNGQPFFPKRGPDSRSSKTLPPVLAVTVQTTVEERIDPVDPIIPIDREDISLDSANSTTSFFPQRAFDSPGGRPPSLAFPPSPRPSGAFATLNMI